MDHRLLERLPILGVTTLIGVPLCTAATVAVLVYSDCQEVETWGTASPSVVIAILSVVANSLLAVALAAGPIISSWHTLLNGCTDQLDDFKWRPCKPNDAAFDSGSYVTFRDPMAIILDAVHELSFRSSLRAGNENATVTDVDQIVPYSDYSGRAITSD